MTQDIATSILFMLKRKYKRSNKTIRKTLKRKKNGKRCPKPDEFLAVTPKDSNDRDYET